MNSLFSPQSIPSRKVQLHSQLSVALEINDEDLLFLLEGKLVHRYGLQSLNDGNAQVQESLPKEPCLIEPLVNQHDPDFVTSPKKSNSISPSLEKIDNKDLTPSCEELTPSSMPLTVSSSESGLDLNDKSEISNQINDSEPEPSNVIMPPPPAPSISHLRRWLPSIADKMSKAS